MGCSNQTHVSCLVHAFHRARRAEKSVFIMSVRRVSWSFCRSGNLNPNGFTELPEAPFSSLFLHKSLP